MSQSAKQIVDALIGAMAQRPEDFHMGEHTLRDKKSGMEIWIANTPMDHAVYSPFKRSFGIVQGFRFRWYLNKFKAWKAAQLLSAA